MKKQLQSKSSQNLNVFRLLVGLITFVTVNSSSLFKLPFYLFPSPVSLANNPTPNNSSIVPKEKSLINDLKLFKLGVPPFRVDAPQNIRTQASSVQLRLLSETPNQITDHQAWFERNNLSLPTYQVPNDFSPYLFSPTYQDLGDRDYINQTLI